MQRILYSLLVLCLGLAACSDDGDLVVPSYEDGAQFVAYDAATNFKDSHDVILARSSALQLCKVEGVAPTDEFAVRDKATGEMTYLQWGYKYAGLQGDEEGYYQRVYYNDTILIGLGFADNWQVSDYDLLLLRGNKAQTLDTFHFSIVKDVEVDLSKLQGGVISVKATGWDNPGTGLSIDSISVVEKATGRTVLKQASACKGDGTAFEMIAINRDSLQTGDYELWVSRWAFDLRQKLCDFSYFDYAFVDSNPMTKDAQGRYQLKFLLKEFADGDNFTITTLSPHANYYVDQRIPFDAACYDAATQTYTYTLDDANWRRDPEPGIKFAVSLTIGGVRSNVSGTACLPE